MNKNLRWIWLYKYSDDLANFFGGILVLCFGLLIFFGITLGSNLFDLKIVLSLSAIVFVGIASYFLMMHFSYKAPEIEKYNKNLVHQNVEYIITPRRLDTLVAAGVAEDVINCLKELLEKIDSGEKRLTMTIPPQNDDCWLKTLKEELGESRIAEYEDSILKYTRKELSKS